MPITDFTLPTQAALLFFGSLTVGGIWQLLSWFVFNRDPAEYRLGAVPRGAKARVLEWDLDLGRGFISIGGERWRATSRDRLGAGDSVSVTSADGLTVNVRRK